MTQDCPPPSLAAILAAMIGLSMLVGGLAAYGLVMLAPRFLAALRERRLSSLHRSPP